jgi:hypothetical protein
MKTPALIENLLSKLFPVQPLVMGKDELRATLRYQYRMSRTVGCVATGATVGVRIHSVREGVYVRGGALTRSLRSGDRPLVAVYPIRQDAPEPTAEQISSKELERLNV